MLGLFALGLRRHLVAVQDRALRLRARRGRGLLHHRGPGARRRVARVHHRRSPSRPRPSSSRTPTSWRPSRWWASASAAPRPTTASSSRGSRTTTSGAGKEPFAAGGARPDPRADDGDPGRARDPVRAARASRASRSSAASSTSCSTRPAATSRAWPRPLGAFIGARQQERPGRRALLELPRQRPAARGRHRPRQGPQPGPAAARGDRRAAGVPGLGVRERLRLQQPGLPRVRPGRPAVPRRPQRPAPVLRARRERRHGAARQRGAHAARPRRPRSSATSTCSARPRSTARAAPGLELGRGARGDGAALARDAAARVRLRVGGPVARGGEGGRAGRSSSSRSA